MFRREGSRKREEKGEECCSRKDDWIKDLQRALNSTLWQRVSLSPGRTGCTTTSLIQGSLINLTHRDPFICVSCTCINTHTTRADFICMPCVCAHTCDITPLRFYRCLWLSQLPCGLSGFYSNPATLSLRQRACVAFLGFAGALWEWLGVPVAKLSLPRL